MPLRDPATVMRDVGRRVAELRAERGWTQDQLAEHAGFSVGYVRTVEGGKGNLTVFTLVKFATLLGVEPAELLRAPTTERRRGRPPK